MIIKTAAATLLAIATSFIFLLFSPTPKSFYHSLFISNSLSDNASISNHLYTLTRRPHVAGQEANAEAAAYVLSIFTSSSIKTHIAPYPVALTYPLFKSIEELEKAAAKINSQREEIEQQKGWQFIGKNDHFKVRELNDRLMMADCAFTDQDGLLGRSWYKHLIYGPSKHDDYGSKSFPGIDEAIEKAKSLKTAESWKLVQHEVWRVARAVRHASQIISGELT